MNRVPIAVRIIEAVRFIARAETRDGYADRSHISQRTTRALARRGLIESDTDGILLSDSGRTMLATVGL